MQCNSLLFQGCLSIFWWRKSIFFCHSIQVAFHSECMWKAFCISNFCAMLLIFARTTECK